MQSNDWADYLLDAVLETLESGSRPPGGVHTESGEIPSIGGEHITSSGHMTYTELKRIPRAFFLAMPRGHLAPMDVLINKDGAQTGKVALYPGDFDEAAVNEHVFRMRGKPDTLDQTYLYYCLLWEKSQRQIAQVITGSAQPGINTKFAEHVRIRVIPLPEQRRVAEILDTGDEAIRQTERLIAKLKAIKAGLLHDLLTRGLDEHGHLRDPQARPEQFKESPLGRIPREWDVRPLGDSAANRRNSFVDGPFGSNLKTSEYSDHGVRLIQLQNIGEGIWHDENRKFIPERKFRELIRHATYPGEIAIAKMAEPVARACIVPAVSQRFVVVADCIKLAPDHSRYDSGYLVAAINHPSFRVQAEVKSTGTTRKRINLTALKTILLLTPPIEEQRDIGASLDAHEGRIRAEEAELAKLRQVKRGLMDDLLTGKVRVANAQALA